MESVTLSNRFYTVKISSSGAELISVFSHVWEKEILWQADPLIWPRHAPILFPIVGRLKNNLYYHQSKSYTLNQHGFARDKVFDLVSYSDEKVLFSLISDPSSLASFPFDFKLDVEYVLHDNLVECTYEVQNTGNQLMYFSIGAHPGFIFPFDENSNKPNGRIIFSEKEINQRFLVQDGFLNHKYSSIFEPDGKTIELKPELFSNDAIVLKNINSDHLFLFDGKYQLKFSWTNFPYFGIWSKSTSSKFICLEPWSGISDAIDSDGAIEKKEGILSLEPKLSKIFSFSFGTLL